MTARSDRRAWSHTCLNIQHVESAPLGGASTTIVTTPVLHPPLYIMQPRHLIREPLAMFMLLPSGADRTAADINRGQDRRRGLTLHHNTTSTITTQSVPVTSMLYTRACVVAEAAPLPPPTGVTSREMSRHLCLLRLRAMLSLHCRVLLLLLSLAAAAASWMGVASGSTACAQCVGAAEGDVDSVTGHSLQNLSLKSTSNHNTSADTLTPPLVVLLLLLSPVLPPAACGVRLNVAVKSCWSALMVARSMS